MQSKIFNKIPGLNHGYSTRILGDMRQETNRLRLVKNIILPKQVHGNIVQMVSNQVNGADGIISDQKGVFVGVLVADCVPILMADPIRRIVAAVHAGWKGTLGNIAAKAVKAMGSMTKDILVSIGPHIGPCCYTVPKKRIDLFGEYSQLAYSNDGLWHLDIGSANYRQLLRAGIKKNHIDAPVLCTSCQSDIFYSYRKDSKNTFGEMLGFIGFT